MLPATYDLEIYQGDDFSQSFRLRETNPDGSAGGYKDLTGFAGQAQVRSTAAASTTLAEFTVVIADQSDMVNGKGLVTLSISHTTTAGLTPTSAAPAVWDFQLTDPGGKITTYIKGSVTIDAQVTR